VESSETPNEFESSIEMGSLFIEFMKPAYNLLRVLDSKAPNVSKAVPVSLQAQAEMEATGFSFSAECLEFYIERQKDLLQDIHYAAYFLDPEFIHHKHMAMPRCMEGLLALIERVYHGDEEMQAQAIAEASCYKNRDGVVARDAVFKAAAKMPSHRWSQMYCASLPAIQKVQIVALSLFASQSESERKHKDMNEIKTKLRNRLLPATTNKLVFIYANASLERSIEASSE
jgi:hypothetical protein